MDIKQARGLIGKEVKFITDNMPEEFSNNAVLTGILAKITSTWEDSREGSACLSFQVIVDVKATDGGVYHLSADEIYPAETPDASILNADLLKKKEEYVRALAEIEEKLR